MDINWNTTYIDLQNLINISRGDKTRMLKYLNQFLELIPPRIESLKVSLEAEDRKMTRQILHQMSPQLQFFGIPDVVEPIRRLELEYETMPLEDLKTLVNDILMKLDGAKMEVEKILKNNFV
jgi:HPt (histidine-containing phosphotransfer) domain-containing protein